MEKKQFDRKSIDNTHSKENNDAKTKHFNVGAAQQ